MFTKCPERTVGVLRLLVAVVHRLAKRRVRRNDRHYDGELEGRTVAVWGLSFKPRTDDMREAPSRTLMEALWDAGATVRAYDPEAMEEAKRLYPEQERFELCETAYEALDGADCLAIVTEWQEFRSPDIETIKEKLARPVIFDGRNLYDPEMLKTLGLTYYAIGRGNVPLAHGAADQAGGERKAS